MKFKSGAKFQAANALLWATMIIASSVAANILENPELITFILIGGWVASLGLPARDKDEEVS